jgi:hypothetical protein
MLGRSQKALDEVGICDGPSISCATVVEYKHKRFLQEIKNAECPPSEARETDRVAFRFVSNPIGEDSFAPHAQLKTQEFKDDPRCEWCGLSMYTTEQKARAQFAFLLEKFPNARIRYGDYLAKIALKRHYGVQTHARRNGHFTFYEYYGIELGSLACLVGPL